MKSINQKDIIELTNMAKQKIPLIVEKYANIMSVDYGRISIRHQRTRWGSCSLKGNLSFNCLLMLMPEYVQDYVVVHELAHRKQMNHSEKFWNIVETILPNYREAKQWLKEHGMDIVQKMVL